MKNIGINFYTVIFCLFTWVASFAQTSTNGVRYQVTYDATTTRYTVWVVPAYNTPNTNNTGTTEKGATAQVTLAVPSTFTITSIVDVNGSWEKTPIKLGPGQPNQNWSTSGLPTDTNYYIIGKSASETDYGVFTSGIAVPLFTFQGVSCAGLVRIIPPNDPFISAADQTLSLNAGNSFYSRSGQPAGGNQNPLEQYIGVFGSAASCGGQLVAAPVNVTVTSGLNPTTISVLPNITVNGSPATTSNVTITIPQQPTFGSVSVNANGTISFTPSPSFSGTGTFDIRYCLVSEPTNCVTSTVTVQSPIVMTPVTTTITSSTNPTTIPVLSSITVGGQPATTSNVTISIPQQPSFGSVSVNANGTLNFTPSPGFSGTGTFDVRVCSVSSPTSCITSSVTVQSQITMTPLTTTITSGTSPTVISVLPNVSVNGSPATSSNVTISIPQQPSFGSVSVNANGTLNFTPSPGFSGTGTFDVRVCSVSSPTSCITSTVTVQSQITMTPLTTTITSGTSPTVISVLPNVSVNGSPATSSNVTISIPQQPSFGSVSVNANGTLNFTPSPGFSGTGTFDVRVCSSTSPTLCTTSTVTVTSTTGSSNLVLSQTVDKTRASVNDQVIYRLVVRNQGPSTATNIQIRNTTSAGQVSISNVPNRGTFASNVWTIPSIASGDSAVLLITNRLVIEGVVTNEAEVISLDQTDPNTLNNKVSSCVSIPMFLCNGQNLQLSVPATFTNVRWFRNGVMIGSGTSINVSLAGNYTTLADNSTCPASGCCPIEVILEECCPPSICIPLTIKKL